jgi:hypothetical protein
MSSCFQRISLIFYLLNLEKHKRKENMIFDIQKSSKRGIECLERLGKLLNPANNDHIATPACMLYAPSGIKIALFNLV